MTAHRRNPDWYRVKYSLAAECFNAAYVASRPLDSWPAAWSASEQPRPGGAFTAEGQASALDPAASGNLAAAEQETRELLAAIEDQSRIRRRQFGFGRRVGRKLDDLLGGHFRPATLILLAGIELFKQGREASRLGADLEEWCLSDLEARVEQGLPVNPYALAGRVAVDQEPPGAAISFNLACFYTQAAQLHGEQPLELLEAAQWHLLGCIEATAPSERERLRQECTSDPVLGPLVERVGSDIFEIEPVRIEPQTSRETT